MWLQKEIKLARKPRGFHLITNQIIKNMPNINSISKGILQIFIKHSSASLTINENSDINVRSDFETHFNQMIPEENNNFTHIIEGEDDMPAHIKSSILGSSLSIPISDGNLNLGIWQGIYLCEHRNNAKARILVLTINGELL